MNETVLNGADINGAGVSGTSDTFVIAAQGYAVAARGLSGVFDFDIAAHGYAVSASGFVRANENTADMDGFAVSAEAYGGAIVEAGGYAVQASGVVQGRDSAIVVADGFAVAAAGFISNRSAMLVAAQGYAVSAQAFGGAVVSGEGYAVAVSGFVSARASGIIAAEGYAVQAAGLLIPRFQMTMAAQGYAVSAEAYGGGIAEASGYAVAGQVNFTGVSPEGFDQAWVMNAHTAEVSRYTNYRFMHLIELDGKPYGVRHDGIYSLSENHGETGLNGTVITKDTDFGTFESKHVNYCYLNNDTTIKITPTVDGMQKLPVVSQFAGRKVKLARGNSGRYWTFKIENIKQIEGVEFTPELIKRQRRVK